MARAQTIQIYLPSGNPAGIRVASITTRTVRVFEVPRALLVEFLKRPEAGQVGVYFLFGSDGDETAQAYIGQTGNVGGRLQQHTKSKDFWTRAMVAVSLTNEWTSTHVCYLEWLSLGRAMTAGRYPLLNGNQASNPHTPEPLEADCLEFLDTIAVLLATLGTPILDTVKAAPTVAPATDVGEPPEAELLFLQNAGCEGRGYLTSEGLLVLAGSRGREGSLNATGALRRRREILESEGVIAVDGGGLVFLKDYLFSSPSAAGTVLVGRSTNGRTNWKNAAGQSLGDLEGLAIAAAVDRPEPTDVSVEEL